MVEEGMLTARPQVAFEFLSLGTQFPTHTLVTVMETKGTAAISSKSFNNG
jgi:hypothetical protein